MSRPLGSPVLSPPTQPPSAATLHGQPSAWTCDYIPHGLFAKYAAFYDQIVAHSKSTDPYVFAIIATQPAADGAADNDSGDNEQVLGYIALMSIVPEHLRLEIRHVIFSPRMQRSTVATEVIYLLLKYTFETGYRRVEWKVNSLNEGSHKAARWFRFTFEGTFRQHMVVKGRNRDTAWYSMVRGGFEGWLDEGNFDEFGRLKESLEEFIKRR
ncbi:GNAT family N-acetyltransferase [Aspergillus affinis]|uniref:GNAT family N-acetyltransferase n=1 Tax=Aspergillus affinis TaxID=1070780 RepID=UPI0022FE85C9|nr:acyl-CoA N-acyltransferase [Aspergillus affinis]KAI9037126.1 acyl-CoA N-acyltransferase [Aspergillus affinis]